MMDWADEEAIPLAGGIAELEPAIADALRAAERRGIERAAEVAESHSPVMTMVGVEIADGQVLSKGRLTPLPSTAAAIRALLSKESDDARD